MFYNVILTSLLTNNNNYFLLEYYQCELGQDDSHNGEDTIKFKEKYIIPSLFLLDDMK